jgi:hypothetical protein
MVLTQLQINGAPSTIQMNLSLGQPSGTTCALVICSICSTTGNAGAAGGAGVAEVTGQLGATGGFCFQLTDVGNIPPNATATYTVTVTHT